MATSRSYYGCPHGCREETLIPLATRLMGRARPYHPGNRGGAEWAKLAAWSGHVLGAAWAGGRVWTEGAGSLCRQLWSQAALQARLPGAVAMKTPFTPSWLEDLGIPGLLGHDSPASLPSPGQSLRPEWKQGVWAAARQWLLLGSGGVAQTSTCQEPRQLTLRDGPLRWQQCWVSWVWVGVDAEVEMGISVSWGPGGSLGPGRPCPSPLASQCCSGEEVMASGGRQAALSGARPGHLGVLAPVAALTRQRSGVPGPGLPTPALIPQGQVSLLQVTGDDSGTHGPPPRPAAAGLWLLRMFSHPEAAGPARPGIQGVGPRYYSDSGCGCGMGGSGGDRKPGPFRRPSVGVESRLPQASLGRGTGL